MNLKKRIGIPVVALTLAFLLPSSIRAQSAEGAPKPIVLKAAHLFDSVSGKLADHGVVVVAGKNIQAVGSEAPMRKSSTSAMPRCCRGSSMPTFTLVENPVPTGIWIFTRTYFDFQRSRRSTERTTRK